MLDAAGFNFSFGRPDQVGLCQQYLHEFHLVAGCGSLARFLGLFRRGWALPLRAGAFPRLLTVTQLFEPCPYNLLLESSTSGDAVYHELQLDGASLRSQSNNAEHRIDGSASPFNAGPFRGPDTFQLVFQHVDSF